MTGFIYSILFQITGQNSVSKAVEVTDRLDKSVNRVKADLPGMGTAAHQAGEKARRSFDGMNSSLKTWISTAAVGLALMSSMKAAAQFEGTQNAIVFSSGSAEAGAKNIAFVRSEADRLGLSLLPALEGFKMLSGSMMSMPGEQVQKIFTGIGTAASVMGISADDTKGAFNALSQMFSKGVVSSEELKGQLGERIVGAFGIAARAAGKTEFELNKMLEKGELMAKDFLPQFATELEKTFGSGLAKSANSATANFNRLETALFDLKTTLGQELLPVVIPFLKNYLIPAVVWISKNIKVVGLFTGAIWALNIAMYANPVGLVIAAFLALVGAVYYVYNEFDTLRGYILGASAAFLEFNRVVYDYFIVPFLRGVEVMRDFNQALYSYFVEPFVRGVNIVLDWLQPLWDAFHKTNQIIFDTLIKPLTMFADFAGSLPGMSGWSKAGERIGNAFSGGFDRGVGAELNLSALLKQGVGLANGGGLGALQIFGPNGFFGNNQEGGGGSNAPGGGGKNNSMTKGIEGITGGGSKNITINATFGDNVVHAANVKEGTSEIHAILTRTMLQVMNSINHAQ